MEFNLDAALLKWHSDTVGGTTIDTAALWQWREHDGGYTFLRWQVPGHPLPPSVSALVMDWPDTEAWWAGWKADQDARAAYADPTTKTLLYVAWQHEQRIRSLEGKAPVTRAQFVESVRGVWLAAQIDE